MRNFFAPVIWLASAFTEDGGKLSFSRVAGSCCIYFITRLCLEGKPVPDAMVMMFQYLVGYQLLSKALNGLAPGVLDLARAVMLKAGGKDKAGEVPSAEVK